MILEVAFIFTEEAQCTCTAFDIAFLHRLQQIVETSTVVSVVISATLVTTDACSLLATSEAVVLGIFFEMLEHGFNFDPLQSVEVEIAVTISFYTVFVKVDRSQTFVISVHKWANQLTFSSLT